VTIDLPEAVGERDETQVHGVEHQLDGHEHRNQVAPEEEAGHAQAEQHGAQHQVPAQRHAAAHR